MKLLLSFLLIASLELAHAGEPTWGERDRAALLESAKNAKFIRHGEVPPEVIRACRELSQDDFALADPGENFQYTDGVGIIPGVPRLPKRQLVWATRFSNFCVLHYLRGGFAPRYRVVIATIVKAGAEAEILWCGNTNGRKAITFAEFLALIKAGGFKVDPASP